LIAARLDPPRAVPSAQRVDADAKSCGGLSERNVVCHRAQRYSVTRRLAVAFHIPTRRRLDRQHRSIGRGDQDRRARA